MRFTNGPEVTVDLVNPAADLPPIGVSEASGGPTVAAIGNAVATRSASGCRALLTLARMMASLSKT